MQNEELPRSLSLLDVTMINIGSMIGSGVFVVPASIALYLGSPEWILTAWVIGGLVSLCGALSIAELGAMMPKAGGQYVYLARAYSPIFGFLYGWANFAVIMAGSIAAIAVGFTTYLGFFIEISPAAIPWIAVSSIIFLTVINILGASMGALIQNVFTFAKIGAMIALILLPAVLQKGDIGHFSGTFPSFGIGSFGLAIIAVLWAYDGWIEITFVGGEVRNPQRNIPGSLILSTAAVVLLYIGANFAFIFVLSVADVAASKLVASDAAIQVLGAGGAAFISLAVMVSMFGANNGFVFTAARIYYAMAQEGQFMRSAAKIHPRFQTPHVALIAQGIWACLLVFSGTYDQLITYVVFASFLFYAMSCGAVFILRKRFPEDPRPYRTWGYPVTPILFILFALYLVGATILEDPRSAAIGTGIILSGIPFYYYWTKKR